MAERYFAQPPSDQSHFATVPSANIERSTFDRSHGVKSTFDAGLVTPVFCDEVLPGDTFSCNSTAFVRMATPLKPFMDNLYCDVHFWYVPYRLVWSNWKRFMGERETPDQDNSDLVIPQMEINLSINHGKRLANAFGIPYVDTQETVSVSQLPFRAYQLIWNEWYRDENLQEPIPIFMDDTDIDDTLYTGLWPRGKRKDYFTSALPWPQQGDPVYVPLGVSAPVVTDSQPIQLRASATTGNLNGMRLQNEPGGVDTYVGYDGNAHNDLPAYFGDEGLMADLTQATAITINDLRTAFQIQRMLERDARGGTRYIELVLSHFGVQSEDLRLTRPEYLGGGSNMININPVAATVAQDEAPQGNLAAVGTGLNKAKFTKSFTEHGVIIGVISVRSDYTYQQGLERMWSRKTRYDFYWPTLAHLGEQAILQKEIWLTGDETADNTVFGYQERFAEYRYKPSRITAEMNSNEATSLDYWHLAQDFEEAPVLNNIFIQENPPIERVIAVTTEPHFLLDMWFKLTCKRPMPVYSVPGLIDHF